MSLEYTINTSGQWGRQEYFDVYQMHSKISKRDHTKLKIICTEKAAMFLTLPQPESKGRGCWHPNNFSWASPHKKKHLSRNRTRKHTVKLYIAISEPTMIPTILKLNDWWPTGDSGTHIQHRTQEIRQIPRSLGPVMTRQHFLRRLSWTPQERFQTPSTQLHVP